MKGKLKKTQLEIDGQLIPVKIYWEARNNIRASMGKTAFILRMPYQIVQEEEQKHIRWFEDWVRDTLKEREDAKAHFTQKQYQTGDTIKVGKRTYTLKVQYENTKNHYGRLSGHTIALRLNAADNPLHLNKSIRHLISRIVASDFLPAIEKRVHELNRLHFQKPIKKVYLKYNQSNWGSCSSKGNVNLSTRLLFAPDEVIDYVIIHELAHLIEMNHSNRFWNLVAKAMPDYQAKEVWLKENGHLCDF
ncbi:MAG: M48 family metallopeptidase [Bacteroidota bacterium]